MSLRIVRTAPHASQTTPTQTEKSAPPRPPPPASTAAMPMVSSFDPMPVPLQPVVNSSIFNHALAVRLVKTGGSATAEDLVPVIAELEKMPLGALQAMQRNHTRVVVCRGSVTDYLSSYAGKAPRGWPEGRTWDSVPGFFEPSRNEVVIATDAALDGSRRVPPSGDGHGSASVVLHESGHSLDYRGHFISKKDRAFRDAYAADFAALPPYLAQSGAAGPEEAFAETLALSVTQGPDAVHYPNLMRYWAEHTPFQPR